jgi:hypothetical protein
MMRKKTISTHYLTEQTFFAMPLLDFSTPTPTSKPGFWIYWAVTAPLTISVLTIYLTYLTRVSRKNRAEDKKVRKDVSTSQGTHLPCASIETNYSDKHHGLFSMLSDAMPESLFGKSSTRVQPNPELGLSGKVEMAQLPGGKKLENSSGITRSGDFQTLPTSGPSGCYIDYDVVETVGVLPHMENVAEGTQYYPPPEPSSSRLRPGRSPSITIDTTYAGWGSSNARANLDSDWDSSSSFGL